MIKNRLTGSPRLSVLRADFHRPNLVVLRNNVVEKVTLPLPIHIRDASRRGSVWQSRVKLRMIE
jgi:hypothetical protein